MFILQTTVISISENARDNCVCKISGEAFCDALNCFKGVRCLFWARCWRGVPINFVEVVFYRYEWCVDAEKNDVVENKRTYKNKRLFFL